MEKMLKEIREQIQANENQGKNKYVGTAREKIQFFSILLNALAYNKK